MATPLDEPYLRKINQESILLLTKFLEPMIPIVSHYVTSQQLTMCSLAWSILLIISGYLARRNPCWFVMSIIALLLHIFTDLLDGSVSEYNQDGFGKWNYFMDHLLDVVFAVSVFIGLAIYYWKRNIGIVVYFFIVLIMIIVNMVASFLMACNQGLDLGIRVKNICFNIFHMHFLLIAFYIYIIVSKGTMVLDGYTMMYLIIPLMCLTIYNIYNKQKQCKELK